MEDKMDGVRGAKLGGTPILNPLEKLKSSDKKSRVLAISAMCAECKGCSETHIERGFRERIRECSSQQCPLHTFRPYQKKTKQ